MMEQRKCMIDCKQKGRDYYSHTKDSKGGGKAEWWLQNYRRKPIQVSPILILCHVIVLYIDVPVPAYWQSQNKIIPFNLFTRHHNQYIVFVTYLPTVCDANAACPHPSDWWLARFKAAPPVPQHLTLSTTHQGTKDNSITLLSRSL